ncbi:MAG TPA: hypothetical protein VD994_20595 [Prosthecobacter sp.]|nr:hypothetical protein [Prosthecobacter sp.]
MRFLLFFLALTAVAHAQFDIGLSLPRSTFMALEAIEASVSVTNRTGTDIVLGGPGRSSWLSFDITDAAGRSLAPIEVSSADMVQIAAGATVQRKVVVTDAYAPADIGNYGLTARVLHPPTNQHYASNRVRFSITDVKPMWEQSFGMPEGSKNVGEVRRYSLSVLRELEKTSLYFRLLDGQTGLRLQTYTLGPVSLVYDPQITLDRTNRLQVLFLALPKVFAHVIIQPDGALAKRTYYREVEGNRPRLVVAAGGEVSIAGGVPYDPAAPAPTEGKPKKGVSERPPGL